MVSQALGTVHSTSQKVAGHPGLSRVEGSPRMQTFSANTERVPSKPRWLLSLCQNKSSGSQPITWETSALLIKVATGLLSGQNGCCVRLQSCWTQTSFCEMIWEAWNVQCSVENQMPFFSSSELWSKKVQNWTVVPLKLKRNCLRADALQW